MHGGRVLFHSTDRAALDRKVPEHRPGRLAVCHTGELAGDPVVVL